MKRSRHNRSSERGAALLMTTVVITLLTIVGAFATRSTGRVVRAAGQARQITATRNIAEQAIRTAAAHVAIKPPFGERGGTDEPCPTTAFQRAERAESIERCTKMHSDAIATSWNKLMLEDTDASGHKLIRKFALDFTDETNWGAEAGEDAGARRQSKRVTTHVLGVVGPWAESQSCGDDDSRSARGQTSTFRALGTLVYRSQ
jgi:hypothetical protein